MIRTLIPPSMRIREWRGMFRVTCLNPDHAACSQSIVPGMRWHVWVDSESAAKVAARAHAYGKVDTP
jgi:hypothetical protein